MTSHTDNHSTPDYRDALLLAAQRRAATFNASTILTDRYIVRTIAERAVASDVLYIDGETDTVTYIGE